MIPAEYVAVRGKLAQIIAETFGDEYGASQKVAEQIMQRFTLKDKPCCAECRCA